MEKLAFTEIPKHSLIIPNLSVHKFIEYNPELSAPPLYGTSTFINILTKEGDHTELEEFKKTVKNYIDVARNAIIDALDDNSLFDHFTIAFFSNRARLIPWTISIDTFWTLYTSLEDEDENNLYKKVTSLGKAGMDENDEDYLLYFENLKIFLRKAIEIDDYVANTYDTMMAFLENGHKKLFPAWKKVVGVPRYSIWGLSGPLKN